MDSVEVQIIASAQINMYCEHIYAICTVVYFVVHLYLIIQFIHSFEL